MISYNSENVKVPQIRRRDTSAWIKKVAALHGKKVGDIAEIKVPQGTIQLEVVSISFD
jgi:hypothetical protein